MKYSFKNDYSEGCHPNILKALSETNLVQQHGYGEDEYSAEAADLIKNKFQCPNASVHFVSGGTQANLLMISSILKPYQSVIAANTGHIFTNEAGSVEATGHKVHAADSADGKLRPDACRAILDSVTNVPHVVQPKMLYISDSTELGSHYTLRELEDLHHFCREKGLYLFMDGARLAQALMVENGDLKPENISRLTDCFYVGGTKNGALLGEALVIINPDLQKDFAFNVKQKGAMLAKGRLIGIQFLELFKSDLYFQLGQEADEKAMKIKKALDQKGLSYVTESQTNQLFPILPNEWIDHLLEKFEFYVWKKMDDHHSGIRLVTSWATPDSEVDHFIFELEKL